MNETNYQEQILSQEHFSRKRSMNGILQEKNDIEVFPCIDFHVPTYLRYEHANWEVYHAENRSINHHQCTHRKGL